MEKLIPYAPQINFVLRIKSSSRLAPSKVESCTFHRISCKEFYAQIWKDLKAEEYRQGIHDSNPNIIFLDVRSRHQYEICSLPWPFQNIPYSELDVHKKSFSEKYEKDIGKDLKVYILCRRGVASQKAAIKLVEWGYEQVYNIDGGLEQWQKDVDSTFPLY